MGSFIEFQVVVLGGGSGRGLTGLTPATPKVLVPVAGRPLLWYTLKSLENAGFQDVILSVAECDFDEITEYVASLSLQGVGAPDVAPQLGSGLGNEDGPRQRQQRSCSGSDAAGGGASNAAATATQQGGPMLKSQILQQVLKEMKVELVAMPHSLSQLHPRGTSGGGGNTAGKTSDEHPKESEGDAKKADKLKMDGSDSQEDEDEEEPRLGTAEVLHLLCPRLKTDVFVVSCDTFGNVDFKAMADLHRIRNGACTMLVIDRDAPAASNQRKPLDQKGGAPHSASEDGSWVVMDAAEQRIIALRDSLEIEHGRPLSLDKLQLFWHPNLILRTNMLDAHVYVFRHTVLQLLGEHSLGIESIKHDLVPLLVKMQNTPQAAAWSESRLDCDDFTRRMWGICPWNSDKATPSSSLLHTPPDRHQYTAANPPPRAEAGTEVSAFVQRRSTGNVIRVNTAAKHHDVNMLFCTPRSEEAKSLIPNYFAAPDTQKECVLGDGLILVDLPKSVMMKRSVIGCNVKVETGVKLTNCVIGDNVVIGRDSTLQGCTISANCTIEHNCKLTSCRVERGVVVTKGTEGKNEAFYKKQNE